jgi:hypothetical protein
MLTLAQSESCDWYVIPAEKIEEWYDKWTFEEELPEWAVYVESPGRIRFKEYECL